MARPTNSSQRDITAALAVYLTVVTQVLIAFAATGRRSMGSFRKDLGDFIPLGMALVLLVGAAPMFERSLLGRPVVRRWIRGVTGVGLIVAVVASGAPWGATIVGVLAGTWLASDGVGAFREDALLGRAVDTAWWLAEGVGRVAWGAFLVGSIVLRLWQPEVTRWLSARFGVTSVVVDPNNPRLLRAIERGRRDAAADRHLARSPDGASGDARDDGGPVSGAVDETVAPTGEGDGVSRWMADATAARALQAKMATLRAQAPGARFTRTISRADERGFVVTYEDGGTEGWLYVPVTGRVERGDWSLRRTRP